MILGAKGDSFFANQLGVQPVPGSVFVRMYGFHAVALMEMTPAAAMAAARELESAARLATCAVQAIGEPGQPIAGD